MFKLKWFKAEAFRMLSRKHMTRDSFVLKLGCNKIHATSTNGISVPLLFLFLEHPRLYGSPPPPEEGYLAIPAIVFVKLLVIDTGIRFFEETFLYSYPWQIPPFAFREKSVNLRYHVLRGASDFAASDKQPV